MSKDEINSLIQMLRSSDEGNNNLAFGIIQENIKEFRCEELIMFFLANAYNKSILLQPNSHYLLGNTCSEIRNYFYDNIFKTYTSYAEGGWDKFVLSLSYNYDDLMNVIINNNHVGFKNNMNIKTTFKDFCQNFSFNFNL